MTNWSKDYLGTITVKWRKLLCVVDNPSDLELVRGTVKLNAADSTMYFDNISLKMDKEAVDTAGTNISIWEVKLDANTDYFVFATPIAIKLLNVYATFSSPVTSSADNTIALISQGKTLCTCTLKQNETTEAGKLIPFGRVVGSVLSGGEHLYIRAPYGTPTVRIVLVWHVSESLGADPGSGNSIVTGSGSADGIPSKELFRFLKGYEAFSSTDYDDGAGYITIGYGIAKEYQPAAYARLAPTCTEKQASEVMADILVNNFGRLIYKNLTDNGVAVDKIKQQHFDAFCSLAYNCGVYGCTSSPMMAKYIANQDDQSIIEDWKTYYISVGTNVENGLRDRRLKEIDIFKNNKFFMKPIRGVDGDGFIPEIFGNDGLLTSARKLLGKPYIWGGNYPPLGTSTGTDCSGLCQWAYNDAGLIDKVGLSGRWTTYTMYPHSIKVDIGAAKPGDVIFSAFSSSSTPEHVAIISAVNGNTISIIEAQQPGVDILERSLTYNSSTMQIGRMIG